MPHTYNNITIFGGGSYGTCLAVAFAQNDISTLIAARDDKTVDSINTTHENAKYLPAIPLPESIHATNNYDAAITHGDIIMLACPAQAIESLIAHPSFDKITTNTPLIICAKGIQEDTGLLLSNVVKKHFSNNPIGILSGPGFAQEMAHGQPTAITFACEDETIGMGIINTIGSQILRPYFTTDIIGVQIAGACKNIIAIACGITHGKELGESARAALMTRGLAEIARLTQNKGGRFDTIMGLSGVGDLSLTCNSLLSRNMSFGIKLGRSKNAQKIINQYHNDATQVVEGVNSTSAIKAFIGDKELENYPIFHTVWEILYNNANIDTAITKLLSRPFRGEG